MELQKSLIEITKCQEKLKRMNSIRIGMKTIKRLMLSDTAHQRDRNAECQHQPSQFQDG